MYYSPTAKDYTLLYNFYEEIYNEKQKHCFIGLRRRVCTDGHKEKNKGFSSLMQRAILAYKMFSLHQACSPHYRCNVLLLSLN